MITYRKAVIEDCKALTEIRIANLDEHEKTEPGNERELLRKTIQQYFETAIADGSLITWLACDGSKIISTSGVSFFTATPSLSNLSGMTGYITNMYTYPDYRRRGIGGKLLELTVEEATALGCGRVVLYTTKMGKAIYERFGFVESHGYMTYQTSRGKSSCT